ncbi:MAG: ubiE [Phycisphaerales bacterium]|nr:ubiE [Phycisphaerales bacterium]MDB5304424.1 ubiE [Phycisphaerales bacterium]
MMSTETTNSTTEATAPAWDDALLRNPHAVADKRGRVQRMFAAIAPSYDLNNRLHSLWMDESWRKKAVKLAEVGPSDRVVDVACGTGDLTLRFAQALSNAANAGQGRQYRVVPPRDQVLGIDFTYEMLPLARQKAMTRPVKGVGGSHTLASLAQFACGDATALPLPDASADVASIAFGIRNVADPSAAVREFFRILRPGGRLLILEFSLPTNAVLRAFYNFYFRKILPRTATLISGDRTGAYKYLPESVNTFIGREQMMTMMREAGFTQVEQHPMTFGVCVCYRGVKN